MSACAAAMGDGCILGATVYDVGKPCRVIATYDAATPRMQVIEDVNS